MNITELQYNQLLSFAETYIRVKRLADVLDKYDVVHDAIVDSAFNYENYKQIIVSKIFVEKSHLIKNSTENKNVDDSRVCKICGETHKNSQFVSGFSQRDNINNFRNVCKDCHKIKRKSYKKYVLSAEQKKRFSEYRKEKIKAGIYKDTTAKERWERYKLKQQKIKTNGTAIRYKHN